MYAGESDMSAQDLRYLAMQPSPSPIPLNVERAMLHAWTHATESLARADSLDQDGEDFREAEFEREDARMAYERVVALGTEWGLHEQLRREGVIP